MKKTIIDITSIHLIDRKQALKLVSKINQYYVNPQSIEIIGEFTFNRTQQRQAEHVNTIYGKLKYWVLERLNNYNDRISIENKFII